MKPPIKAPTARFNANPCQRRSSPCRCALMLLSPVMMVGIIQYLWNFGDGNSGEGDTLTHTYAHAGIYTAQLTVLDTEGALQIQKRDSNYGCRAG